MLTCLYPAFRPRPVGAWLLLLLLLLGSAAARAQTKPAVDSSRISYDEETMPAPLGPPVGTPPQNAYTRLTRLQVEERQLWKLGLNNFGFGFDNEGSYFRVRYGAHLAYERKIGTEWSVLGEISPDVFRYYRDSLDQRMRTVLTARVQVAGRYYYNLNQRIRKGKSASNFSANYLGLGLGAGLGRFSNLSPFYNYYESGQVARATAMLQYGLQRRLGPYGFVDFNLGIPFLLTPDPTASLEQLAFRLRLNLRIGLALGR
ncbi:hypothetical protein [Hymenobacter edaphi]|uniref:Outer membrane protein beta-barrel domain-containing protein n=1 Tax=Hymenobacter edaphi TaxID=2211146 RepID=A0A328BBW0_9BACT|nr:hypothetical protein [Hymenobacter edaphi]RAK63911.1 hypothetical protein DLM85_20410 [Hymenobacter edaphi]